MGLPHVDFFQVTSDALDCSLKECEIRDCDGSLRGALLESYNRLDAYPEAVGVLEQIRKRNVKAGILSNGSPRMLSAAVESTKMCSSIDSLISVDSVGVYKPHPRVYQLGCDILGVSAANAAFVSANWWDVVGASAFGHPTVWINRHDGSWNDRLAYKPTVTLSSLEPLAAENFFEGLVEIWATSCLGDKAG
jgi:2-haloacid dehalogenase